VSTRPTERSIRPTKRNGAEITLVSVSRHPNRDALVASNRSLALDSGPEGSGADSIAALSLRPRPDPTQLKEELRRETLWACGMNFWTLVIICGVGGLWLAHAFWTELVLLPWRIWFRFREGYWPRGEPDGFARHWR
jgi:hypothetical protein